MKNSRIQTLSIVIPAATAIATRSYYLDSDSSYKLIKGFYAIRNTGTDYIKISVLDHAGRPVIDSVNLSHLEVNSSVEIDKRISKKEMKAEGSKVQVTVTTFTVPGVDQNFDILFDLANE